jgi:hypothetical protein
MLWLVAIPFAPKICQEHGNTGMGIFGLEIQVPIQNARMVQNQTSV